MMVPTTSSVVLVITLCFIGYNMVKGDTMTSLDDRRLQTTQTLNFRATYKADFQHLHDFVCTAEPPILQVSCRGKLTILNVSDSSISCVNMDEPFFINGTSFECTNSCTTCTSVYENFGNIVEGPFASIEFMCEGNDIQQVDALYEYLGGNAGQCASSESTTTTRNFHVGRLGVYCPIGSTGSREYVYDDTYVECSYGFGTVSGYSQDIAEENENDIYTCVNGDNCGGMQCTVPFGYLRFFAELPRFSNACVESLVAIPTIPEDPQGSLPAGRFIVQFNATWAQLYPTDSFQTSCTSTNPSVLITCGAGSSIAFINSTDLTMFCDDLNSSELLCTGDPSAIQDTFVSVIYTCAGTSLPVSSVMYPESSASCIGSTEEEIVSHAVSLGLLCEDSTTTELFFYYGDRAFECAEAAHSFDYEGLLYGWDTLRFICSESMTFAVGSTSPQTIRNVTVSTDESWRTNPDDNCYNVVAFPTAPIAPTAPVPNPPTTPPTITPTASPVGTAQELFVSCSNETTDSGTAFEFCQYNVPSPLTIELASGNSVRFGDESQLFTGCVDGVRSTLTCICSVIVNPSDPIADTDFCNNCTVQEISDTTFVPYFDCSNRLVGDCVGIDAAGMCIANNTVFETPAPVGTTIPPTPLPVASVPSLRPVVTVAPTGDNIPGSSPTPVVSRGSPTEGGGNSTVGIAIGSAVGGVALAAVIGFVLFFSKRNRHDNASKPTNESHYTESNTNDDFASYSRPPTTPQNYSGRSVTAALVQPSPSSHHQRPPPPLYPMTETSSNQNRYDDDEVIVEPNNKREVFVPPPDMPPPAVRTSMTRQSAASSHRSSYPTNHVVDVKDQCRSVAMVRSSSPTIASQAADSNIPFAVALGVTTTTMPSVTSSTSSRTSKKEPAGRTLDDY